MTQRKERSVQPCWFCRHAIPYEGNPCPWAMRFEPVPGWEAEPDELAGTSWVEAVPTYRIIRCPLKEPG